MISFILIESHVVGTTGTRDSTVLDVLGHLWRHSADQDGSMVSVGACIVAVRMELDLGPLSNHDNLNY